MVGTQTKASVQQERVQLLEEREELIDEGEEGGGTENDGENNTSIGGTVNLTALSVFSCAYTIWLHLAVATYAYHNCSVIHVPVWQFAGVRHNSQLEHTDELLTNADHTHLDMAG